MQKRSRNVLPLSLAMPLDIHVLEKHCQELSSIFRKTTKVEPGLFLLNIPTRQQLSLSTGQQTLMVKLLLLARRCIIFQWIEGKPPTVREWYRETFKVFPMERLSATLKGNDNSFYNIWQPFIDYLPDDFVDLLQKGCPCFVFTNR